MVTGPRLPTSDVLTPSICKTLIHQNFLALSALPFTSQPRDRRTLLIYCFNLGIGDFPGALIF